APADEGEGDVIGLRGARLDRRVGIVEVARKLAGRAHILGIAVGPQALVALLTVLAAQRLAVDRWGRDGGAVSRSHGPAYTVPAATRLGWRLSLRSSATSAAKNPCRGGYQSSRRTRLALPYSHFSTTASFSGSASYSFTISGIDRPNCSAEKPTTTFSCSW